MKARTGKGTGKQSRQCRGWPYCRRKWGMSEARMGHHEALRAHLYQWNLLNATVESRREFLFDRYGEGKSRSGSEIDKHDRETLWRGESLQGEHRAGGAIEERITVGVPLQTKLGTGRDGDAFMLLALAILYLPKIGWKNGRLGHKVVGCAELGVVGCFPRICVHDNRLQPICRPESLDRMNMILPASGKPGANNRVSKVAGDETPGSRSALRLRLWQAAGLVQWKGCDGTSY